MPATHRPRSGVLTFSRPRDGKRKEEVQESIISIESPPPDGSDLQERRKGKLKEGMGALIISIPIFSSILSSPPGKFPDLPLGQIGFEGFSFII